MLRSMMSSAVGLRAMQTRMDVIGDNIANVNTPGFKASRVTFADLFAQTVQTGTGPVGGLGGRNPIQIGMGTTLSSVDMIMATGTLQYTGRSTDMAIQGSGFFVLADGRRLAYTRAGNFNRDMNGYLVSPATGMRVQGWAARPDGTFGPRDKSTLTDIQISGSEVMPAVATRQVALAGTLNASAPGGAQVTVAVDVFDSLGRSHPITITLTRQDPAVAPNRWAIAVASPDPAVGNITLDPPAPYLDFRSDGTLDTAATPGQVTLSATVVGADNASIALDFTRLSQFALAGADSDVRVTARDGRAAGVLDSFFVDQTGTVIGVFTNGERRPLAQVALATFPNPEALLRAGANTFVPSPNSGIEQIGPAGTGGRGDVAPGNLEAANVDIAAEFTNMIITQRAYQANSRIITASDEMLQDLVNIKR